MSQICPEIAGKWSSSYDTSRRLAKVKLAQEVLAEIPDQLTGFMKSRGIIPKKRQQQQQPTEVISSPTNNEKTTPTPKSPPSPVASTSNGNSSSSKPNVPCKNTS